MKIIIPIALGIFLVWYLYYSTTEAQREQILGYIKKADPIWIMVSVLIGMLSHVSRAIRWNYLLEPMGYRPKITNNVLIILTAYLTNLGVPRSGEFLRATALTTYEDVPFEKGFGTIVTERVVDVLMLLLIIITALLFQTELILGFLKESGLGIVGSLSILLIGILGLFIAIRLIRKSTAGFALKVKSFLKNMMEGILSIGKMRNKWAFIAHTIFIWFAYFAMFWVVKFTVPETTDASLGALLIAFVGGAIAMMTTNGGFLAYPVAVSKSLEIFSISAVSGTAFGWIMWISQTLMIVVFGAISFLVLPLWNKDR
ncbi:lysylphosphatidylglycerol synthase transmembrane domain-containing protein [Pelagihabitans pacificus]|uniref:lysylphosphatidylglycerol synthase transmembrane domain-containing protein n=1 Tax=Pelagihabitans pacificus TaxID=2696054 RepID=UPI00293B8F37|nr:lysylphosphatidylglycerol synthase transmembrane domain-containing protein [Pelagihabitans pacificus]